MKIRLETITRGLAAGKQTVVVEGYGSFQVTYVEHPTLCAMSHLYISHSIKDASIKLCFCLQDIADHLGCDCEEMANNLPEDWAKEYVNQNYY